MGRKKKPNRFNEHECRVCGILFEAVRDDARYCGPTCRKKISRATLAQAKFQKAERKTVAALKRKGPRGRGK